MPTQAPDDLRHLLATGALGGALGVLVGVARYVITQEQGSILGWVRGLVAAGLVGVLVAWTVDSMSWVMTLKGLAIALAAYIAPSMLHIIVLLGYQAQSNPWTFLSDVLASLRGGHKQ